MSRVPAVMLAAATAAFCVSVAAAQNGTTPAARPAPPPPKNLQVFPKDIPRPELIANMKFFSQSLGVRCTFCHVGVEGQPSSMDFASDTKKEKLVARKMLVMVHAINQQYFRVTDFSQAKVTCVTCHHGSPHPETKVQEKPAGAMPPAEHEHEHAPPPKAPERG
jgi:hypothetical protein